MDDGLRAAKPLGLCNQLPRLTQPGRPSVGIYLVLKLVSTLGVANGQQESPAVAETGDRTA